MQNAQKQLQEHLSELQGLYSNGSFLEMESRTLALLKKFPAALILFNILGCAQVALGKLDEAVTSFRNSLKLKPDNIEPLFNLANTLKGLNLFEEALQEYQKILQLDPGRADVLLNQADVFNDLDRHHEAIVGYRRAIEIKPDFIEAHFNLAGAMLRTHDAEQAIAHFLYVLKINPDFPQALSNFAEAFRSLKSTSHSPSIIKLLIRCLETPEIDSEAIRAANIRIIKLQLKTCLDGSTLTARDLHGLNDKTQGLLIAVLRNTLLADAKLEHFLTDVRSIFLNEYDKDAPSDSASQATLLLLEALAHQNFLNEHVWYLSDADNDYADALQSNIVEEIIDGNTPAEHTLYLLSACRPLYPIEIIKNWGLNFYSQAEGKLKCLLKKVIVDPATEKELAENIKRLTPVDDRISIAVQSQYEQNPYPRWDSLSCHTPMPYTQFISTAIAPNSAVLEAATDTPNILIAGCGSGKHPLTTASSCANSNLLAIDLSSTSLAYAKRKAAELEISNVKFAQADILKLGELNEQFDVIESVGVLHHMDNPQAGLFVLLSLLKPGGFIKLGLYSETARQQVVLLRQLIEDREIEPTAQSIRQFRHNLINREPEIFEKMARSRDFYTTSAIRDLLFHVREHRFTIPQLEKLITDNQLEFLGFHISHPIVKTSYKEMFPEDPNCTDLRKWDRFEQKNPAVFGGMYQFWCRKRLTA